MSIEQQCAADNAWLRLGELEHFANKKLSGQLSAFEGPFRDTYEAGIIVPVLRANGLAILDVRCAALFFKRVLNDLRSVWLLLRTGYTSQAASVAASLYENSLAATCLTISKENIETFRASQTGEIPWSPIEMAKMVVQGEGKVPPSKEYENCWRSLYAHYVWLCQSKHPTFESVVHDTSASALGDRGYVVMALPNVHSHDVSLKAMVAIISLIQTIDSIEAFAAALGYRGDSNWPDDFRFKERLVRARDSAWKAFEPYLTTPNPISIARSWFPKKYPPVA